MNREPMIPHTNNTVSIGKLVAIANVSRAVGLDDDERARDFVTRLISNLSVFDGAQLADALGVTLPACTRVQRTAPAPVAGSGRVPLGTLLGIDDQGDRP